MAYAAPAYVIIELWPVWAVIVVWAACNSGVGDAEAIYGYGPTCARKCGASLKCMRACTCQRRDSVPAVVLAGWHISCGILGMRISYGI